MKTHYSCLFFGQRSTDRVIYRPSCPIKYSYKTLQFFPFSRLTSWRDGYFILKGLPNDIFPKEDLCRVLFILYLKTTERIFFFVFFSLFDNLWFTETDSRHPVLLTRQTLPTDTVFVLLSAGVLHSGGHVVGGLHIWRASHPETSLPWKIWNRPNQQDFQGTWVAICMITRLADRASHSVSAAAAHGGAVADVMKSREWPQSRDADYQFVWKIVSILMLLIDWQLSDNFFWNLNFNMKILKRNTLTLTSFKLCSH